MAVEADLLVLKMLAHAQIVVITVSDIHVLKARGSRTVLLKDSVPGAATAEYQQLQICWLLLSSRCGSRQPEGLRGIGRYVSPP